jgi:GTP cyclohydrolase I
MLDQLLDQSASIITFASHKAVVPSAQRQCDSPKVRAAVRELLLAIGEDPEREGLRDTPDRVARSWTEILAGFYEPNPDAVLDTVFRHDGQDLVLVKNIEFESICEHYLLHFTGVAHVGYIPNGWVTGLSKLARLVDNYARRLQFQEQLTSQIADALMNPQCRLQALGAVVVVKSGHSCMSVRGVRKPDASTITYAVRGVLEHDVMRRQEALTIIQGGLH